MTLDEIDNETGDPPLQPLLRWAEPILAPARERSLRQWSAAARRQPDRFDMDSLARSIRTAFAGPALAWSCRALLFELAIARHQKTLQGESPEQRFAHFLDGIDSVAGRQTINAHYPPLHDDIARLAGQTEKFLGRFLQHITDDYLQLAPLFREKLPPGRLQAFAMGQGDRHDHGGSVVKLRFDAGRALYKPRSLAMDVAYARLVADLAEAGVEPVQKTTSSLVCGNHGYAGWIDYAPVADAAGVARYYERFGGVVAIAYLLNCSDLHLENLIACGEYPVLVDLETVFQPWISRYKRAERVGAPYAPTVLVSGLLPGQLSNLDAWDISALAWAEHRYSTRHAVGMGTDQLRLAPTDALTQPGTNLPHFADGRRIPSHDYANAIVSGFERSYRGLRRIKPRLRGEGGLLAMFAPLETRTVLRSTQIYARLLDAMSHPQYLRSDAEREAVVARLDLGSREWPALKKVQPAERVALLRGDVPKFSARVDGRDIRDGDGQVVRAMCEKSGWAEAQRRLRGLSLRDLRRQRYALAQSLECDRLSAPIDSVPLRGIAPVAPAARPYRGGSFLDTAIALGDDLLELSFQARLGIVLFQPEYRDSEKSAMSGMGATLYEGLPGVMLLFAQLGLQTGLARFTRAADAALLTSRRMLKDDPALLTTVGAFGGVAGWIYALLVLGVCWKRRELIDEAADWLPVVNERIVDAADADLITGASGCLLVLLQLQQHRPATDVLAAAAACAARLLETARRGVEGAWWETPSEPHPLTGLAHGTAGAVAALARYYELTGDGDIAALVSDALRYERTAFVARGRRWYDRHAKADADTDVKEDICSWCHGAPGVGLARLLWPVSLRNDDWRADLQSCVATTQAQGLVGTHALCHGQMGNLDLLLQFAVLQSDDAALAECRRLGQIVLDDARAGWRCGGGSLGQEPLGLMIGVAGIAYGCLRLANPHQVPSILSLAV
ncbi:MAG: type 2 lanthipeptide synthetase LanM family protein [Rhodanobacter sp.]